MKNLIDNLINDKWLKTPKIIAAFRKIKREDFLPDELRNLAELDEALPIGFRQTISQPLTVAFMLELLKPESGDNILDVGSGSGWTTALLAFIACPPKAEGRRRVRQHSNILKNVGMSRVNGKVVAVEVVPELYKFGKRNVEKYRFIEQGIVEYILSDGSKGYAKHAPYDKILVSAAISDKNNFPKELKSQLKIGGRLVSPIKNSIWLFIKKNENDFQKKEFPGFVFVPLV